MNVSDLPVWIRPLWQPLPVSLAIAIIFGAPKAVHAAADIDPDFPPFQELSARLRELGTGIGFSPEQINSAIAAIDKFADLQVPQRPEILGQYLNEVRNQVEAMGGDDLRSFLRIDGHRANVLHAVVDAQTGTDLRFRRAQEATNVSGSELGDPNQRREEWFARFPDLRDGTTWEMGPSVVPDLMRIQEMTMPRQGGRPLMAQWFADLEAGIQTRMEGDPQLSARDALLAEIESVEARHGFPQTRVQPVGILPPEHYLALPAIGYAPEDMGAPVEHGELSHRLQWYAIMKAFEADRDSGDPWNHTPFELYTGIGLRDLAANTEARLERWGYQRGMSIWGFLLDLGGANTGERDFRRPNDIVGEFRDATEDDPTWLPRLRETIVASFEERQRLSAGLEQLLQAMRGEQAILNGPAALAADALEAVETLREEISSLGLVAELAEVKPTAREMLVHRARLLNRTGEDAYVSWEEGARLLVLGRDWRAPLRELRVAQARQRFGMDLSADQRSTLRMAGLLEEDNSDRQVLDDARRGQTARAIGEDVGPSDAPLRQDQVERARRMLDVIADGDEGQRTVRLLLGWRQAEDRWNRDMPGTDTRRSVETQAYQHDLNRISGRTGLRFARPPSWAGLNDLQAYQSGGQEIRTQLEPTVLRHIAQSLSRRGQIGRADRLTEEEGEEARNRGRPGARQDQVRR